MCIRDSRRDEHHYGERGDGKQAKRAPLERTIHESSDGVRRGRRLDLQARRDQAAFEVSCEDLSAPGSAYLPSTCERSTRTRTFSCRSMVRVVSDTPETF